MSAPVVPPHLRRFVVQQDYAQYDAVDQAVWRFVLLQTHARLVGSAHPAYRRGLAATGISVERIPKIDAMNECLGRFGWGAVCVDGFIPPRAFQEFQSLGILPIAADMRTREHLAYTPAPDIIHEAAGHAPILPDAVYSSYLRRIGDAGRKAFTLPEEARADRAIRALSEVKEDPAAGPRDVRRVEVELEAAIAAVPEPSEAARLSRLYWWTAEYGIVGRPGDYRLYGAGLLSSLGESVSCHDAAVRKVPLDERCVDVAYDITRPQPQLFVAADFEALHAVLDRVTRSLAATAGGPVALARALRSAEAATIHFASGASATGVLKHVGPSMESPAWLDFDGPVAVAYGGDPHRETSGRRVRASSCVVTGRLDGGISPEHLEDRGLAARCDRATGRHRLDFASGVRVEGSLRSITRRRDGRLATLTLDDARIALPGAPPRTLACLVFLAASDVTTAHAATAAEDESPQEPVPPLRVPRPRDLSATNRELLALYERAERAHTRGHASVADTFPAIHDRLQREFPDEWLLRWNLLESLLKAHGDRALARSLRAELEGLEVRFDGREPIASGLRYLAKKAA
jgi:phenylalanine-4-hydroxylase